MAKHHHLNMPNIKTSPGKNADILLLGAGAFFLLVNIVVFFGMDAKPSTWLFYLDVRHWGISISLSVALWAIVLWLAAESTDAFEDYLPMIRTVTAVCVLLAIVFAVQSSFNTQSTVPAKNSLWYSAFIVVAVFCAVRSLFLLYGHYYGEESIDMEEAQWFWGMSGFLFATLIIIGLACIIHVPVPTRGTGEPGYVQLYGSTQSALNTLIRNGSGSVAIRALAFLIFVGAMAFVYVAGKWALIFVSRLRGE